YFNLTYLSTLYTPHFQTTLNQLPNPPIHPLHQPPKIFLLHHTSLTHQNTYPIPILLPLTHLHQLLIPQPLTIHTTLIPHSPQTPQLHHLPSLLPYPPNALLPYLPQRTIQQL
ncbi:glutamate synthase central domain-containing protein, partial [Staphylococcus epidermidis]|uniref:glutamate synthase central domain-containing protein n=1 Tax=Staphylococcus epidermidis TaxID=1282 RepID=UPI0016426A6C